MRSCIFNFILYGSNDSADAHGIVREQCSIKFILFLHVMYMYKMKPYNLLTFKFLAYGANESVDAKYIVFLKTLCF